MEVFCKSIKSIESFYFSSVVRFFFSTDDGSVYDHKFRLIETKPSIPGLENLSFPQPEKYNSLIEYEQSVLNWKNEMFDLIGQVKLPNVVGRYYFRPRTSALRVLENSWIY